MPNQNCFYQPRQNRYNNPLINNMGKETTIPRMFNSIAKKYDLVNDLLSFGIHRFWLKKAIRQIKLDNGFIILDIATGTGNLAFEFLKENPNVKVIGIDVAEKMLEIARKKNEKMNLNVEFNYGDATDIPYPDNSFDVVSISYGIRNIQNIEKCLFEIHRTLKPDGSLLIVEFGQPVNFLRKLFHLYQNLIIKNLGSLLSNNSYAYRYFVSSVNSFPCGLDFLKIIEKTNLFSSLKYLPLTFGITYIYFGKAKKNG